MTNRAIILLLVLALVKPAIGQTLEGSAEVGFQASSGNSEVRTTNAALRMDLEWADWRHSFNARVRHSQDAGETTTERYRAGIKSDYNFTEFNYVFVTADFERDRFAGLNSRTSQTVGYGRRLVKSDAVDLDAEIGGGLRQIRRREAVDGDDSENEGIGRAAAKLRWSVTDATTFRQEAVVEEGSSNTYVETVSSLSTTLIGNLFWRFSFTFQRNSDVAEGRVKSDRYTALSLGYEF